MSKLKVNLIALSLVCIVVIFFSLKDDYNLIISELYKTNLWWFLLSIFLMFLYLVIRTFDMHKITNEYEKGYTFFDSFKIVFLGQFFANITPSSFGAQPAQIYFLTKDKMRTSRATKIVVLYNVYYQMALVLIGIISFILALKTGVFDEIMLFKKLVLISLIFHAFILLVLLGINFSRKSNRRIIKIIVKVLTSLRLVKDKEVLMEKLDHNLNDFHTDTDTLLKNKKSFFISLVLNILAIIVLYSIPLVLFKALDFNNISLFNTIISSSYINVISSFIPSPGGTGGFEYFFMQFFGVFMGGALLKATMLLWRGVTYYLILFYGLFVLLFYKERKITL